MKFETDDIGSAPNHAIVEEDRLGTDGCDHSDSPEHCGRHPDAMAVWERLRSDGELTMAEECSRLRLLSALLRRWPMY